MNKMCFISAALACALMSCGTGKNSVAVVDFTGEWNIVEVNGAKISTENSPFLGFDKDGHRLYGNAGCNRLMGSFELDTLNAGKMRFGQVATTRMMCPDMTLEKNVLEALDKVVGYETAGETVILNDADRKPVILLQKREVAAVSVNDLSGAWEIVSVKGNPIGKVEKKPQLVFDVTEKRVHGNASCNIINGSFTQEEGQVASLRFSQMISTMMACPNMDVESSILKALDEVRRFEKKSDGTMSLLGPDGREVLSLKKLAETEIEA